MMPKPLVQSNLGSPRTAVLPDGRANRRNSLPWHVHYDGMEVTDQYSGTKTAKSKLPYSLKPQKHKVKGSSLHTNGSTHNGFQGHGSSYHQTSSSTARRQQSHGSKLPRPSPPQRLQRTSTTHDQSGVSQQSYSWSKLDLSQLEDGSQTRTEVVLSMRQSNVILSPRVYNSLPVHTSSSEDDIIVRDVSQSHKKAKIQQFTMGPVEDDSVCDIFFQPSETESANSLDQKLRPMSRCPSENNFGIFRPSKHLMHVIASRKTNIPQPKNKKSSPMSRDHAIKCLPHQGSGPFLKPLGTELPNGKENLSRSLRTKKSSSSRVVPNDSHSSRNRLAMAQSELFQKCSMSSLLSFDTSSSKFLQKGLRNPWPFRHHDNGTGSDITSIDLERLSPVEHSSVETLDGSVTPLLQDRNEFADTIREADLEHLVNQRFLAGLKESQKSFAVGFGNPDGSVSDLSVENTSSMIENSSVIQPHDTSVLYTRLNSEKYSHQQMNQPRTGGRRSDPHWKDPAENQQTLSHGRLDFSPSSSSDSDGTIPFDQNDISLPTISNVESDSLHISQLEDTILAPTIFDHPRPMLDATHGILEPHQPVVSELRSTGDNLYDASPTPLLHRDLEPSPSKQVHFRNPISVSTTISPVVSLKDLGMESPDESSIHENDRQVAFGHRSTGELHRAKLDDEELELKSIADSSKNSVNHGQSAELKSKSRKEISRHRLLNHSDKKTNKVQLKQPKASKAPSVAPILKSSHDHQVSSSSINHDQSTGVERSDLAQKVPNGARMRLRNTDEARKTSLVRQAPGPLTTSILTSKSHFKPRKNLRRNLEAKFDETTPGLHSASRLTHGELSGPYSVKILREDRLRRVIEKSPEKERQNLILKYRYFKIWRENIRLIKIIKNKEKLKLMKATSFHSLTSVTKHFLSWRILIVNQQTAADELHCHHLLKKGFTALLWSSRNKKFKIHQATSGRRKIKLTACFEKWKKRYCMRRIEKLTVAFSHWKTRYKNKTIINLFATRRKRVTSLQIFFFWRERFHSSLHFRMATEHYCDNLIRKTWHLWRIHTAEKVMRKSQNEVAEIKCESWILSRTLDQWKQTTTQFQYARIHHARKVLSSNMKQWKHSTSLSRIHHQREVNLARGARRKHLLIRHFSAWIRESKMRNFRKENEKNVLRFHLIVWKSQMEKHRVISTEFISHRNHNMKKQVLISIAEYARHRKTSRTQGVHKLEFFMKRKAMTSWHLFTMRKVKLRNMQKMFYLMKIKKNMQALFIKWKFQLEEILDLQEQQRQWTLSCVKKAVNKWIHLLRRKQMERVCAREIVLKKRKILHGYFFNWRRLLAKERRADERGEECRVLLVREKTRRMLRKWDIRTQEAANIRPFIHKMNKKRVQRCFGGWALLRNRQVLRERMLKQIDLNSARQCFDVWKEKLVFLNKRKDGDKKYKTLLIKRAFSGWRKHADRYQSCRQASDKHQQMLLHRLFYIWATKTTFKQIQESRKCQQHFLERANAREALQRWKSVLKEQTQNEEETISRFNGHRDLCIKKAKFTVWCETYQKLQKAKSFASENTKSRLRAMLNAWHIIASECLRERMVNFTSSIKSLRKRHLHLGTLSKSTQSDRDITIGHDVDTQTGFERKKSHRHPKKFTDDKLETTWFEASPEFAHADPSINKHNGSGSEMFSSVSSSSEKGEAQDDVSIVMTTGGADSGILLRDYVSTATSEHGDDDTTTNSESEDLCTSREVKGQNFEAKSYGNIETPDRSLSIPDAISALDFETEVSVSHTNFPPSSPSRLESVQDDFRLNPVSRSSQNSLSSESHFSDKISLSSSGVSPCGEPYVEPVLKDQTTMSGLPVNESFPWAQRLLTTETKDCTQSSNEFDIQFDPGLPTSDPPSLDFFGGDNGSNLSSSSDIKALTIDGQRIPDKASICDQMIPDKFPPGFQKNLIPQKSKIPIRKSRSKCATYSREELFETPDVLSRKLVEDKDVETFENGFEVKPQMNITSTRNIFTATDLPESDDDMKSFTTDLTSLSSADTTDDIVDSRILEILKKKPKPTLPIHPCLRDSTIPMTEWLVRLAILRLRYRPLAFTFHQWRLLIHVKKWKQEMVDLLNERHRHLVCKQSFRVWSTQAFLVQRAKAHHNLAVSKCVFFSWMHWTKKQLAKKRMKAVADGHSHKTLMRKYSDIWRQKLDQKRALLEILSYWQTKTRIHNSPRIKDARSQLRKQQELLAKCFITWKLHAKQLEKADNHWNRVITKRYFSAWSRWASDKAATIRKCDNLQSTSLKKKTFAGWRRYVLLMNEVNTRHNRSTRNWVSALIRRWHDRTEVNKQHCDIISRISSSSQSKTTTSCFNVWKEEWTKHKLADIMHRRCLVRKFIQAWRVVIMEETSEKKKTDYVQDMVAKHSRREVMVIWFGELILRNKVNSMQQNRLQSLVIKTWIIWKEKTKLKRASMTYSVSLKKRMLNGWKKFLQERRKSNEKARTVLLKWHRIVVKSRLLSSTADEFCSRSRMMTIEITFNTWVVARSQNVLAKKHRKQKVLKRCLVAWAQWMKYKRNLIKMQQNYVNQRRKELFAISWHKWKYRYQIRLRNSNVITMHKKMVAFRTLRQHWLLWKQRKQTKDAERIYNESLVVKCFSTWVEFFEKLKKANRIAEEHKSRKMRKMLFSWASYTLERKNERQVIADLGESRNRISVLSAFMIWMKNYKNAKIANTFWDRNTKKKAFHCLLKWKEEQKRLKTCYEQAVQRIQNTMLKFYFTQWKSMYRKGRMLEVTCDQVIIVKKTILLKKSWKIWFKAKEKRDLRRLHERDLAWETIKKWKLYAAARIKKRQIKEERNAKVEKFKELWTWRRMFAKWRKEYLVKWFTKKAKMSLLASSWTLWMRKTAMNIYATDMHRAWTTQKFWHLWRVKFVTKRAADEMIKTNSRDLIFKVFRSWRAYTYEKRSGLRFLTTMTSPRSLEMCSTPKKKSRIPVRRK